MPEPLPMPLPEGLAGLVELDEPLPIDGLEPLDVLPPMPPAPEELPPIVLEPDGLVSVPEGDPLLIEPLVAPELPMPEEELAPLPLVPDAPDEPGGQFTLLVEPMVPLAPLEAPAGGQSAALVPVLPALPEAPDEPMLPALPALPDEPMLPALPELPDEPVLEPLVLLSGVALDPLDGLLLVPEPIGVEPEDEP
jgi:hypothetical protein